MDYPKLAEELKDMVATIDLLKEKVKILADEKAQLEDELAKVHTFERTHACACMQANTHGSGTERHAYARGCEGHMKAEGESPFFKLGVAPNS